MRSCQRHRAIAQRIRPMGCPVVPRLVLPAPAFLVPFLAIGPQRLETVAAAMFVKLEMAKVRPHRVDAVVDLMPRHARRANAKFNQLLDARLVRPPFPNRDILRQEVIAVGGQLCSRPSWQILRA